MKNWPVIGDQYGCEPTVSVVNEGNVLVEVSGSHMTEKTNSDVKTITVQYQVNLLQMPKNIETFFPNLIRIQFWNGNISSISVDDLKAFPNLQVLSFGVNLLTSLDGNLFIYNPKLQWISFSGNKITNVGYDLLLGLDELRTVNFNFNTCINKFASTPSQLIELKNLLRTSCPSLVSTQAPTTTPTREPTTSTTLSSSTTPDSTQCPTGCLEKIEDLQSNFEAENRELRKTASNQGKQIEELTAETVNLNQVVAAYEERFIELEKQIREIDSNPRQIQ
jgi:Leucine rich repeat